MKILHITLGVPALRAGGLINYSYSIAKVQHNQGHEVTILYPGHYDLVKKKSRIQKVHKKDGFSVFELVNPSFVAVPLGIKNPELFLKEGNDNDYRRFLEKIKPDLIHIHTFMGFHGEFFDVLKHYPAPVVYTTHDYYAICPKTSMINEKNELCECGDPKACARCNADCSNSFILQYVLQSRWYPRLKRSSILKNLKKRRKNSAAVQEKKDVIENVKTEITSQDVSKYQKLLNRFEQNLSCVDLVHCNSTVTEQVYNKLLECKKHFVLNISSDGIKDLRQAANILPYHKSGTINIGFIGIRDFHKGYSILRDAGKILYDKGYKFSISFYGDEFNIDKARYPFCNEMGMFPHEELPNVCNTIDLMVIPAFWYETFGFATLEAIANGVPVLASSHAGAKDLLKDISEKHVFEPNAEQLAELIAYYLDNPARLDEAQHDQEKLTPVFSMEKHNERLLTLIDDYVNG